MELSVTFLVFMPIAKFFPVSVPLSPTVNCVSALHRFVMFSSVVTTCDVAL